MEPIFTQKNAKMTQGFAALCMLVLHLFCRTGTTVYGNPLIWMTPEKPLVYYFGFFAEICVPLYSICAGYARVVNRGCTYKGNLKKVLKLLKKYWIILFIFSSLGLITGGTMPGSACNFMKSVVLLYSYNGAWWFLNTYIILMLIPVSVILFPVEKLTCKRGIIFCLFVQICWYFIGKFVLPYIEIKPQVLKFLWNETTNIIGVLPYYWGGCLYV